MNTRRIQWLIACLFLTGCWADTAEAQRDPYDSGGPLMPEQAAYDVTYYDLDLFVQPADSTINGILTMTARIVQPAAEIVLNLDPLLSIRSVSMASKPLAYRRRGGEVWIAFPYMKQPGEAVTVAVAYGGRPRIAPRPPWTGGFTWARTPGGAPWIATTCQGEGADVWWPVKDHVSDKPDSMALHIRVPDPLVVATNGALRRVESRPDGTSTYHWFISTPISAYNVALNIAPYRLVEDTLESVAGGPFPIQFYVLSEAYEQGRAFMPEIKDHLRFYERTVGPYPFRADKYGVVMTPHLGMEHQSMIAYGANFNNGAMTGGVDWGFDALHHHELSHEWWGNLVTNADWSDMWIHEGFGTYMQALYLEQTQGIDRYHAYLASIRDNITNRQPVASRGSLSSKQIYGGDIYFKGGWVLHSLRYLIGDDLLRVAIRRMAYPDPMMEKVTDGRQVRFATTDDFLHLVEGLSGKDLDWFFEVYVRTAKLPRLVTNRAGTRLELRWETPDNLPFPMPVDVQVGTEVKRVEMRDGRGVLTVPENVQPVIDPLHWVLKAEE